MANSVHSSCHTGGGLGLQQGAPRFPGSHLRRRSAAAAASASCSAAGCPCSPAATLTARCHQALPLPPPPPLPPRQLTQAQLGQGQVGQARAARPPFALRLTAPEMSDSSTTTGSCLGSCRLARSACCMHK